MADLAPPALRDFGLLAGLRWLIEQMRHHGLAVSLQTSLEALQLPENEAIPLFQSIRELLTNVVKHAQSEEAIVSLDLNMGTSGSKCGTTALASTLLLLKRTIF